MTEPNLYDVLGIPNDADAATVKAAYRRKAADSHPDKPGNDGDEARERFALVCLAGDVLKDELRRKRYDEMGDASQKSEMAEILEVISAAFDSIIAAADEQNLEITTVLMMPALGKALAMMADKADDELRPWRRSIEQHRKLMTRFTPDDGPNAIDEMIRSKIGQIEAKIAPMIRHRELITKAEAMLKGYSFRADFGPNIWPNAGFTFAGNGSAWT